MTYGAIGRPLRRIAGVLALAGLVVGCAGTSHGPASFAPADFGKDDASRAERLVRYCDRLAGEGKYITALGLCARAHELSPDDPDVLMRIAGLLKTMDRDDAAAQTYSALLAQHPGHAEALYGLGKVYMESGRTTLAATQFNHAMTRNPADPRPYNALGIIRDQAGEHQAAQALYRSALERDPYYLSARNNLGLSLALDGNRDEAIAVLAEVAVEPGADETVLHNLEAAYTAALPNVPLAPAPDSGASAPVLIRPLEGQGAPSANADGDPDSPPQTGDGPIPLMMPNTAGEGEQTSSLQPDGQGLRQDAGDGEGPLSVIATAVARLLEPPAWADFEPGELLAVLPPEEPLVIAPKKVEPAVQEPVSDEVIDGASDPASLEMAPGGDNLAGVDRPKRPDPYYLSVAKQPQQPDPYYLSMLMVGDAGFNV
ncbi:tetratricopeptide repeat protein [Pelagibius sp.]|uniref:tetratricopeptide repeat protein n=1 Tax=Pelagibius sp. TaxID=1931238 RepID=UPI003BB07DE0